MAYNDTTGGYRGSWRIRVSQRLTSIRQTRRGCTSMMVTLRRPKARTVQQCCRSGCRTPSARARFSHRFTGPTSLRQPADRRDCGCGNRSHIGTARIEGDTGACHGACTTMARPAVARLRASTTRPLLLGTGTARKRACVHAYRLGILASGRGTELWISALVNAPPAAELVIYADPARGTFRYASIVGRRLDACLFIARDKSSVPSRDPWRRCLVRGSIPKRGHLCSLGTPPLARRRMPPAKRSVRVLGSAYRHCTARS